MWVYTVVLVVVMPFVMLVMLGVIGFFSLSCSGNPKAFAAFTKISHPQRIRRYEYGKPSRVWKFIFRVSAKRSSTINKPH